MKTVVTITGIRPDFIRMSFIFKKLDEHFHHVLIHTGQHYDKCLSDVFFEQLGIRKPDYVLHTGKESSNHYEQLSYLAREIPQLFAKHQIVPDIVLFLGDSNSAGVAFPLKKEGYRIGHIEAGMRSYDKRMLEEINRTVCDHCSDILFVYHEDYMKQLAQENITKNVYVVGNTIVEPLRMFQEKICRVPKRRDRILVDIHRPENFKYPQRLKNIITFANQCIDKYQLPVDILYFKRLKDALERYEIDLGNIQMIPLLPYEQYLDTIYHARFIISDSGTGQEEPALLGTPVVVPRDFTERPQSYDYNCSVRFQADNPNSEMVHTWLEEIETGNKQMDISWLGDGTTSTQVVQHLLHFLE